MTVQWRRLWDRYYMWAAAIVTAALVLFCYGFVLRLPFFFDDLPIMSWLSPRTWIEIWTTSSENDYFRPLSISIYKLGQLFPKGMSQVVLHGANLLLHWFSAMLVMHVTRLRGRGRGESFLAAALFAVFPFMFEAVPWITAMGHTLVTALTALAVFAALKAGHDSAPEWWGVSLVATGLAPFAHESGVVCAVIVAGLVVIQRGLRLGRAWVPVILGMVVSVGAVVVRSMVPGVGGIGLLGLQDWVQNTLFYVHGLVYPVGPLIGWLVRDHGAPDLTLVTVAGLGLLAVVVWLASHRRDWRWSVGSVWWWAWGALPAAASLRYGYLFAAPRLHALSAAGVAMLWAGVIGELASRPDARWVRTGVTVLLAGTIVTQNVVFLRQQRSSFQVMNNVYQAVLRAAEDVDDAPLGFVNLPRGLGRPERTYAMIHESVMFLPPYSNIEEFIAVNRAWRPAETVVYSPVLEAGDLIFNYQGEGLTWEEIRRFALEYRTVWLARWRDGGFSLDYVGGVEADATASSDRLAHFDGGVVIESASVEQGSDGSWAVLLSWLAPGPVDARMFLHVVDADGNLVAQADGPALGGMLPPWIWEPGDRVYDVRWLSPKGPGPFSVRVGLFGSEGRLPAYQNGLRCPEDAPTVARIHP